MDVVTLHAVAGKVVDTAERCSKKLHARKDLPESDKLHVLLVRATYNRGIKESIFKVGVASQKLLAKEGSIFHIFPQTYAERVLRQVR